MDTTTNYALKKPAYEDGADIETLNENTDKIDVELKKAEDHRSSTTLHLQPGERDKIVGAVQSATLGGAAVPKSGTGLQLPAYPTFLPNPQALTISQGYGGQTGAYDGSAAVSVSVPRVTINTASPTATLADGELWGVY